MNKPLNDLEFWQSARVNTNSMRQYYNRLVELSVSMFEWKNVPDSVDVRFLELCLFTYGYCLFFKDEVLGYLTLNGAIGGKFNVYRIPTTRNAIASNGYHKELTDKDSVIIYNNFMHLNSMMEVVQYATRLGNLDRAIDVNVNAQKTPILISCEESQRLTLKNLYMKYDGNQPFIFGDKQLNPNSLKAINTGATYVADKMYTLKTEIWNEALTYLGINNVNIQKKERLITDEVSRNQGGVVASRYSRLEMRKKACKEINKMFGLEMDVEYRQSVEDYAVEPDAEEETENE